MSALIPSFDPAKKCPKCNASDIHTAYHREMYFSYACTWGSTTKENREHLHRSCHRCGYDWIEAPLDSSATQERQTA